MRGVGAGFALLPVAVSTLRRFEGLSESVAAGGRDICCEPLRGRAQKMKDTVAVPEGQRRKDEWATNGRL